MPAPYSREGRRANGERLHDSNSRNSTRGMVTRWLDGVSVATTSTTTTTTQFSRAGTLREVVTRTRASEAVFQTYSQEVRDLFSIPTPAITRSPRRPAPTFHFEPLSAFDSYDTTPNSSALPSPSQQVSSSRAPNRETQLAQVSTRLSTLRHLENLSTASFVPGEGYNRSPSASGRIATGGAQRVFSAGEVTQRTLGDIAPGETDAIRNFWAEIGTEEHGGQDGEYSYVAVGGGIDAGGVTPEGEEEGEEEEEEEENEINYPLEYPDITQISAVPPPWSDDSSSTSSESSLSSGGLTDWDLTTLPQQFLEWDVLAERVEEEARDADFMRENPLHLTNQIAVLGAPFPLTWVDTALAPFVFPTSPATEVPSIFAQFPPGILSPDPLTQFQELENWTRHNLAQYSRLLSTSTSASTSSTLPHDTLPVSPGVPWDPTAADSTACPICYENQITREFPCSVPNAQHGLCGPCFVEYEGYCTDVVRCPLCRHEFFGSQVVAVGPMVGAGRRREEAEGEGEEGVGGDERSEVRSEAEGEVDGEYETVDEEEIEFYMGGQRL